jgi:hypothetical protein
MHITLVRKNPAAFLFSSPLVAILTLAVIFWATGLPLLLRSASASQVTVFSDTLSDSNLGALAKHTIQYTISSAIYPNQSIKISLDPSGTSPSGTSAFVEAFSSATTTDITLLGGATPYSVVSTCNTGNEAVAVGNYNNGTDENLTLTLCPGAALIATSSVVSIVVGASTKLWTNPSSTGSLVIRLGGSNANTGDTRVAVLQNVTVTASIDTTFTFTVSGLASGSSLSGQSTTTSTTTSATAIGFGTLLPGVPVLAGQELTVATNAKNGFVVTVQEDQPLTSSTGAYIPLFSNGATTTSPIVWTVPTNTLDQPWTYSHIGVITDDSDLSTDTGQASDNFTGTKFAGNIITPRAIFAHTGPSDGSTQDKGKARVGYEIQIGSLQAAGNDYTNKLTYVATPTF